MPKPAQKYNLNEVVLLSLCIAAGSLFLSTTGIFDIPKLKTVDFFSGFAHKIRTPPAQISQITLVKIDDESYKRLDQRWPWGRDPITSLLRVLKNYQPKIICLDLAFVGKATPEEDNSLSQAMKETGNVFIVSYFGPTGEYVLPQKVFSESALAYGFIDKFRDKDNTMRSAPFIYTSRNLQGELKTIDYSVELKMFSKYLGIPLENVYFDAQKRKISLKVRDKEIEIRLREDMSMLINYTATLEQFRSIPFWKIIRGEVSKEDFKDKIVIVGATSEIFHDIHPTPLKTMPGLVIAANNFLMLLSGNFIKDLAPLANFLILVFLCLGTGIVVHRLSLLNGLAAVVLEITGLGLAGLYLRLKNWQGDFFSPAFGIVATYGAVSLYEYVRLLKEASSLRTLAITDGLTGLFVHRYFQIRLQYEFDRVQRYAADLSFVILDIDHFKHINDAYGHEGGNIALKAIAQVMRESSRKIDILARYGGEEFCSILPKINLQGALNYAERLRREIEKLEVSITENKKAKVTVSIGVASFLPLRFDSSEELIECADRALYEAKRKGRNMVCYANSKGLHETPPSSLSPNSQQV